MNPTNDPGLRSFVPVAPESHFPIQNLPYGVFRHPGSDIHVGVAIGDYILDLTLLDECGLLETHGLRGQGAFRQRTLNAFLGLGRAAWAEARAAVSRLLRADEPRLRDDAALRERGLVPQAQAQMLLPVDIGDFTDFY